MSATQADANGAVLDSSPIDPWLPVLPVDSCRSLTSNLALFPDRDSWSESYV